MKNIEIYTQRMNELTAKIQQALANDETAVWGDNEPTENENGERNVRHMYIDAILFEGMWYVADGGDMITPSGFRLNNVGRGVWGNDVVYSQDGESAGEGGMGDAENLCEQAIKNELMPQ